jgi:hypothetical protein
MADGGEMEYRATGEEESAGEHVKQRAQQAVGQVQNAAEQFGGQARTRLSEQVDKRSTQLGEQLRAASEALRSSGDELEDRNNGLASVFNQVAERTERLGGYLAESDGQRLLRDVERFAQRRPWVVGGGALIVGLVASRLLKASSRRRYESERQWTTTGAGSTPAAGRSPAAESGPEPLSPTPTTASVPPATTAVAASDLDRTASPGGSS